MSAGRPAGEYLPALDGVRAVAVALVQFSQAIFDPPFEGEAEPPAGLALTFAAAVLSYYLLERPLLRWTVRSFGRGRPAAPTPEPR